ncbi:uncharacterized protein EKO05_0003002 [Ascochyta rabiei]|uniref:uncharacterized protein n=1 Tax=Didymella rabiei TaxID=5454 RepID=UPI002204E5ED|nr:uncharacterized protein EKO05_0003002 [Ascochyta rabiei]UPX12456.1 hypothetical protein EKO05_0003002 [Ascochyta rabiei]
MVFVFSAAVVESGLGLSSLKVCRGAVLLCLSFYMLSKVLMYLFLVERVHALRAPFVKRVRDWVCVTGFILVVVGFTSIAVVAFIKPLAEVSAIDGRCRIGIPRHTTLPLLLYDVSLNILLTSVFIHLSSPLVRSGKPSAAAFPATHLTICLGNMCGGSRADNSLLQANRGNQAATKKMERMLLRTFVGSVLVMIPTIGNVAALTALQGRELGWVCLIACSSDGSSAALDRWLQD